MTGSSIVATKEIEEWKATQERDLVVQGTNQRVRQNQERNAFALTLEGLFVQELDGQQKLVLPTSSRQNVPASCFNEPTKGQPRIHRTMELTKQCYWWKGMCKDIENFVRSYLVCQVMKSNKGRKLVYSSPFCFPHSKWEQIATALVLDLPPLARYTKVVVFVDCFNEMVHFAPRTKESMQIIMLNYQWTMYFDYMSCQKQSFQIWIQGSPVSFRGNSSSYSERISDSAQRFNPRLMDRVR